MNKRFTDKNAIVTGGGSGIGKAVSLRLAREGASILVADIQDDKAREVVDEITEEGGRAEAFKIDLRDISQIDQYTHREKFYSFSSDFQHELDARMEERILEVAGDLFETDF